MPPLDEFPEVEALRCKPDAVEVRQRPLPDIIRFSKCAITVNIWTPFEKRTVTSKHSRPAAPPLPLHSTACHAACDSLIAASI